MYMILKCISKMGRKHLAPVFKFAGTYLCLIIHVHNIMRATEHVTVAHHLYSEFISLSSCNILFCILVIYSAFHLNTELPFLHPLHCF